MTADELLEEFERRHHPFLYHACTVTSFLAYCEAGAYRSRAAMDELELETEITPQPSDEADHKLRIWNHLFLNVYDLHADVSGSGTSVTGLNKYGPVLMAFDVAALKEAGASDIWSYRREITSPEYDAEGDTISELRDFVRETFAFTAIHAWSSEPSRRPNTVGPLSVLHFPDQGAGISLDRYLDHIIVDALPTNLSVLEAESVRDVVAGISDADIWPGIHLRDCVELCGCRPAYGMLSKEQVRRFFYEDNIEVYELRLPKHA